MCQLNQALGQTNTLSERLVAMFHRSIADRNKDRVLSEFPRSDSTLRTVFATVAFGMGIDIPDIEQVIHWGAQRGLEQFAQESGRAGRNGRPSLSCVYFSGHDIAKGKTTTEVHEYCQSTCCLREVIHLYFKLEDSNEPSNFMSHNYQCYSFCHSECKCGNCISYECLLDVSSAYWRFRVLIGGFGQYMC
jgi:superfamily II DNA helicase RecQ